MKPHFIKSLLLLLPPSLVVGAEPVESHFYTETIGSVSATVNVVSDYGANGADGLDDSPALQSAIDAMTLLPRGGKIVIPEGKFHFALIDLKSNVHLEFDSGATVFPTPQPSGNYSLFRMGLRNAQTRDTVVNTSIRGVGGRFKVDLRGVANPNVGVVSATGVDNFLISDMDVLDERTKFSAIMMNLGEHDGEYNSARNGLVKNVSITDAHYGYGMVQVQVAENVLFKNLHGAGGATLRLESGSVDTAYARDKIIGNIFGRDISSSNGKTAVMLSPHSKDNGHVDIDRVTSENTGFAVTLEAGYVDKRYPDLPAGSFAPTSVIANVHAVYGETSELKWKHFRYVPCAVRNRIAEEAVYEKIHTGPSAAAVLDTAAGDGPGEFNVKLINVTQEGFLHQPNAIVTPSEAVIECPRPPGGHNEKGRVTHSAKTTGRPAAGR